MAEKDNFLKNKEGHVLDPNANFFLKLISGALMYIMILFFLLADFMAFLFQAVYFTTFKVPKIKRSDYVVVDRQKLSKLNLVQKIACVYCGYANGVIAWIRAILIQVEIYSCAIRHRTPPAGQPHIDEEEYEDYEKYL